MLKNNKTVEDTHATRDIVEAAVGRYRRKEIMATKRLVDMH